jgi:hypothetical protein
MEKVTAVSSEATSAVKQVLQKKHGGTDLLSQVRIIVPIRPGAPTRTKPQPACSVLRWLTGD